MKKPTKRIFVASALRGDFNKNIRTAERLCRWVVDKGHAPYAPHLLYTRFMSDDSQEERDFSIECGKLFLETCDELWAFGNITPGMAQEIEHATKLGLPVSVYSDMSKVLGGENEEAA